MQWGIVDTAAQLSLTHFVCHRGCARDLARLLLLESLQACPAVQHGLKNGVKLEREGKKAWPDK